MAKTISSGESSRGFTFALVMNETIDIESNTSSISWTLQLSLKSGSGWSYYDYGMGWSAYINGTRVAYHDRYTSDRYTLTAGNTLTLNTGTITVQHDTDGSKTISCSASMDMASSPSGAGPMNLSGDWVLTTIPRASTLTIPTLTIGSSSTLTVTAASNSFTHEISYAMSDLTGTIASLGAGVTTTTWTPPSTFYAKIPNATSGNVSITIDTYSGASLIGSRTYTVPVNVGSDIKPTEPTLTLTPVNTNAWLNTEGLYVGDYSRIRVQSSASPGSGASIVSYTVSGAFSATGADVTSGVLTSGNKSITVTATDSRGRSTSKTVTVAFLEYSPPALTTFMAERGEYAGGSWTADVNGDHIRINAVATVSLSNEGNTGTITALVGGNAPDVTSAPYYYWTSTNATTTYTASASVTDNVGNSSSRGMTIPTVEVPFNINVDLPGIGVGMIAQKARTFQFPSGWNVEMDGVAFPDSNNADKVLGMNSAGTKLEWKSQPVVPTLATVATSGDYNDLLNKPTIPPTPDDYVVEEGTSGNWRYRKWDSGISECWARVTQSISGQSWGGGTEFSGTALSYPTNLFIEAPSFELGAASDPSTIPRAWKKGDASTSPNLGAFRPDTSYVGSSVSIDFSIHAIGKWK